MKILKLSLTKAELLGILSANIGTQVEDLDITDWVNPSLPLHEHIIEQIEKEAGMGIESVSNAENKIRFIKAFRTVVPGTGLKDAKWVIENWNEWITFVANIGRIPVLRFFTNTDRTEYGQLSIS